MNPGAAGRDAGEVEAVIVDRYLDALLARQPRAGDGLPRGLREAAERLALELPRQHPSFGFEERLAGRIATAAAGMTDAIPARLHPARPLLLAPIDASTFGPATGSTVRPVLIGGVLTSAAISLAGAAWVAWRRSHPPLDPMTRAIRSVARTRLV